jgi:starvation-inducible DNA-binding protein
MSALGEKLKVVLADTFALYLKAHNYHWNIEGPDFYEYHGFFEKIYTEVHDAVDDIAEHIRALGEYSPGGLGRFKALTSIEDELTIVSALESVNRLKADNETVLSSIMEAYKEADKTDEIGLSNFLQDRYDAHKKLAWMLKASSVKS